jgi:hypothetical protein
VSLTLHQLDDIEMEIALYPTPPAREVVLALVLALVAQAREAVHLRAIVAECYPICRTLPTSGRCPRRSHDAR